MDTMIRVRMNQIVLHELDTCAKAWNTTRSDVIRRGIHRLYDDLNR
ncbi:CopG family transcriptional regulator [Anaeromassilibacillus sp. SJQ-1]